MGHRRVQKQRFSFGKTGGVHTENMSSDDGRLVKHRCVSTMIKADFAVVAGPTRDSISVAHCAVS